MTDSDARKEFDNGLILFKAGSILRALGHFERSMDAQPTSLCASYYAYCMAKERGHVTKGVALCREALAQEPGNPVHYLNLARIHLLGPNKEDALKVLREGIQHAPDPELAALLAMVGVRKPPVMSFLHRDNPINKFLGILLKRLGMR
ncbi:tetratricopeptide repeat protein [Oryzomonas japonica]|uniref:Tetratricopeptide repeat protein n=1 Tax=Oryzomonas japonica TaxID=2603858 RepID=A0A7J4ZM63_9BACT|nr:tetratricopeptide repeat protein [Oryzomonas japonica]KAB0663621.1 tetratricopeptide repeat protein [Oryzomonas japonica]